jgi:hypothetical protein
MQSQSSRSRFWLLAALAVIGLVYSVFMTRHYVTNPDFYITLIQHRFAFEILRVFWSAVLLAPITIAVTLLRVRLAYAALIVLIY